VAQRDQRGRGDRVIPGVWRLRLPLPWPPIPHGNAWALSTRDGLTLVDTGIGLEGSLRELERALDQTGHVLDDVTRVVCTHAHPDHCGAAPLIRERTGAEVWLHPDHAHGEGKPGVAGPLDPSRALVEGMAFETDTGAWRVYATPGHAPSHVVLHQPERRMLLSGDHVLGRPSLYFDFGYTDDPVAEFLRSLERVDALDARLALAGHGRPFVDVHGHVAATRELVAQRLAAVRRALADGPLTPEAVVPRVYGDGIPTEYAAWLGDKVRAYLRHLERLGVVRPDGGAFVLAS